MVKIGYSVQQEQYPPAELLIRATEAERAGFDSIWSSDHFHPFSHTNASCGFAWVWMASAAERTKRIEIGTAATCPILRYNPAIIAQAFATMGAMYPKRIFISVGTGEAMNEVPVGYAWPSYAERAERLEEAIKVMKLLWSGSFVNFKGKYHKLRKANLYTKPSTPPKMYVAASGPTVAEMAGKYGDGFLTVPFPEEHYRNVLFPALERGAKSASRDFAKITKALEVWISYDEDYDKALKAARFWAACLLPAMFKYEVFDPREVELHGSFVGNEQLAQAFLIGTTPENHIKRLENAIRLGFDHLYIMSSSPDEMKTIKMYEDKVLPYIKSTYR